MNTKLWLVPGGLLLVSCLFFAGRTQTPAGAVAPVPDYPITPVPFTAVRLSDHFWKPRLDRLRRVTLPHELRELYSSDRVRNFHLAARTLASPADTGRFCTIFPFDDTDLYKVIQGISYLLQLEPDPVLRAGMDSLIRSIAAAQEADGYLYTARTINPFDPPDWSGHRRWEKVESLSHELYNSGHLFQAAAAHYAATGKRDLLDIALRNADLLDRTFGWGKLEKYPGHPEVELGLVDLYRATGERRYLELSKFFLDVRGPGGPPYAQAQRKVIDQRAAVGHAVRGGYLYAAMTDVSALTGEPSYLNAVDSIWQDMVSSKIYVTGGIGSTSNGEAFGRPFELPNLTAYCETCASIANVMLNQRLFLSQGDARYYDVLERTLYNALLSGISLQGDAFFYVNALESTGQYHRDPWFGCSCCPTNMARFLPTVGGLLYATRGDTVYVNLYAASEATISLPGGSLLLTQVSDFPRTGKVLLQLAPEHPGAFALKLRIPGWALGQPMPGGLYRFADQGKGTYDIRVNGRDFPARLENGYAVIDRPWKAGDRVELDLPMEVRTLVADPRAKDDRGKMVLQRGPLVYCLEWPDQPEGKVLNLVVPGGQAFSSAYRPDLLGGVTVVQGQGASTRRDLDGRIRRQPVRITAIPYWAWANRGQGEMSVWLPQTDSAARPLPAPTIAGRSKLRSSRPTADLRAVNDQWLPSGSNDHSVPYYHWWPVKDTTVWLEYHFDHPRDISSAGVYWFDDRPDGGCRVPQAWRLLYRSGDRWLPVQARSPYGLARDTMNTVSFEQVRTGALRMELRLTNFSAGLYEWEVN